MSDAPTPAKPQSPLTKIVTLIVVFLLGIAVQRGCLDTDTADEVEKLVPAIVNAAVDAIHEKSEAPSVVETEPRPDAAALDDVGGNDEPLLTDGDSASETDPKPETDNAVEHVDAADPVAALTASVESLSARVCELTATLEHLQTPPVVPVPPEPEPVVSGEAAFWDEIARLVEAGAIDNTDSLLLMADTLATSGDLTDVSRLAAYRPRVMRITDDNRAAVARTLRGD